MNMQPVTLTNHGWMGLGIYIGFKAAYRRSEMNYVGVDYDKVVEELTKVGLMKGGRLNIKEARAQWKHRFDDILPSQHHQYREQLGFPWR